MSGLSWNNFRLSNPKIFLLALYGIFHKGLVPISPVRLVLGFHPKQNITKKIEQSHTKWAIDYVRYYDLLFIETCRDKVSSSATEAKIKSVLSYIRSRGEEGISKREVDRHELFRSMKSYEVKEIIERLRNAGEIQEIEVKIGGKGRPTKRFVAVDPSYYED